MSSRGTGEELPAGPRHIAIIMDGNGRWAARRGLSPSAGHKAGVERIRDLLSACRERGVEVLTLFAFSSENWQRPPKEVELLMSLFHSYLGREARRMRDEGVRLRVIGRRDRFSPRLQKAIAEAEAVTAGGERGTLVIAADYGGRWDIARAARQMAEEVAAGSRSPDSVTEDSLAAYMTLADLPPVDLLVRSSGEQRISNFILWQAAYSEFYFTDTLWPDFGTAELDMAIEAYQRRDRRFGGRNDGGLAVQA
ncbi:Ditrans,polycis-undecaprenyl-diphosphate synthase ((2E,6E)-farnesyl-diphosphate specific) [Microbulbifer aggregans]|uniref:Ditrans,polycis-undecaprenyl-diphosphate synthase ((2E,6E)-farnesyl-diphosphate specific) n=1 Tax=Microbulbifer aggregans TaxID=1769779 RepID=A0A1C9WBJ1_9GAMM|nr:polyprenyl diphosphate synthase [Microbulbifer aggregans]AOS98515.1 Ditrans,polycis-undecaprenyl-diphosphate synthase ((2E,6E)-farnesyl-diphosphate specific) [Microbulbifer aggregans]